MIRVNLFHGWVRHALTWCRTDDRVRMELSRSMNLETELIEWHVLVWTDDRSSPLISEFVGNNWHDVEALAMGAIA